MDVTIKIRLPELPKRYVWVNNTVLDGDLYLIQFAIYKKWGWFHKLAVAGDTFSLSKIGDPDDLAEKVSMQAELLVMQLPTKIELPSYE